MAAAGAALARPGVGGRPPASGADAPTARGPGRAAVAGPRLALPSRRYRRARSAHRRPDLRQHQGRRGRRRGGLCATTTPAWRELDLPHDFVVEGPFEETANVAQGYRPKGVGLVPPHPAPRSGRPGQAPGAAVRRHRHQRHRLVQRQRRGAQLERLFLGLHRHHRLRPLRRRAEHHRRARRRRPAGGLVVRGRRHLPPHLAGQARAGPHRHRRRLRPPAARAPTAAGPCRSRPRVANIGEAAADAEVEVGAGRSGRPAGGAGPGTRSPSRRWSGRRRACRWTSPRRGCGRIETPNLYQVRTTVLRGRRG